MSATLAEAFTDETVFGEHYAGPSWARWIAVLKAADGVPLTDEEAALFREVAQRNPPTAPARERFMQASFCGHAIIRTNACQYLERCGHPRSKYI